MFCGEYMEGDKSHGRQEKVTKQENINRNIRLLNYIYLCLLSHFVIFVECATFEVFAHPIVALFQR